MTAGTYQATLEDRIQEVQGKFAALDVKNIDERQRGLPLETSSEVGASVGSAGHLRMKPPQFDVTTPWNVYRRQLEASANANGWSSTKKATALTLALRGDAQAILQRPVTYRTYLPYSTKESVTDVRRVLAGVRRGYCAVKVLEKHITNSAKNATYLSPQMQNEIIQTASDIVTEKNINKIHNTDCFSILGVETMDVSDTEQLSLCLRYVDFTKDPNTPVLREDFVGFVPIDEQCSENLSNVILQRCKELKLDIISVSDKDTMKPQTWQLIEQCQ
ncbi:unnamed protein product [Acanthoscelides obtectus]|uniref:DUF4371 domain-containing protein n=1 Tax=Acanthoscelides obtectus TaxID=200917 RepID=A0A9P0PYH1_ACAOB|nr:unnamed protein product [Acanthoscelides obtectus]CAK1651269.1 hypothetical protein AOBTE_LOCUS17145 [Acanthoscelides obtectus]